MVVVKIKMSQKIFRQGFNCTFGAIVASQATIGKVVPSALADIFFGVEALNSGGWSLERLSRCRGLCSEACFVGSKGKRSPIIRRHF